MRYEATESGAFTTDLPMMINLRVGVWPSLASCLCVFHYRAQECRPAALHFMNSDYCK